LPTGEDGIILCEQEKDRTMKWSSEDRKNYIRAISYLCKRYESRRTCIIHHIERLNRYYGIPPEFQEIYPKYKVPNSFRFRICEYIKKITSYDQASS